MQITKSCEHIVQQSVDGLQHLERPGKHVRDGVHMMIGCFMAWEPVEKHKAEFTFPHRLQLTESIKVLLPGCRYALMAEKDFTYQLYGATNPNGSERAYGWWRGDGPTVLWANIVWCFVIFAWGAFWMVGPCQLCFIIVASKSANNCACDACP